MSTFTEFHSLAKGRQHRIFTFAYYFLGNREDAEDVTQDVLIKWWRHRETVESAKLDAWITSVTRNACVDSLRRKTQHAKNSGQEGEEAIHAFPDPRPCPRDEAASADTMDVLIATIGRLPELQRTIVILREVQGLRYDEVAAAMDIPMSQVKVYLHRARKKLREALRERVSRGEL